MIWLFERTRPKHSSRTSVNVLQIPQYHIKIRNRLKLLNLTSLELRRLRNDLAWCYRLTVLKFDDFLSGFLLPLRHVVMLFNFIKETAHTDPEPYFSQSVLLMYGTNYLFQLILDHYRRLCVVSAVLTYRPTCIYIFCVYCVQWFISHFTALHWAAFSARYALWSWLMTNKDDDDIRHVVPMWTPSIHSSLYSLESTYQTTYRSVQPFLQGSRSWQTDLLTNTPTDHDNLSEATGRIYVVLWCGLIISK